MKGSDARSTPDGKYLVVRGRLWRRANPLLSDEARSKLVADLMDARRALQQNSGDMRGSAAHRTEARARVHAAKVALGERGPVWWTDGTPDFNRRMAVNTPYRDWFLAAESEMSANTGAVLPGCSQPRG